MNETQYIAKRLRPFLRECGFAVVHKSSERFSSGWPDLTCVHAPDGETVYVEAKGGINNNLTPLQRKILIDLAKAGAKCFTFRWNILRNKSEIWNINEIGIDNYWPQLYFEKVYGKEDR